MPHFVTAVEPADSGLKVATFEASFRGMIPHSFKLVPWVMPHALPPALPAEAMPEGAPMPPVELIVPETRFAATVKAAIAAVPALQGSDVICAYPSYQVSTRKLHFPLGDIRKVEPMISFELEDQLPRSLDELMYSWVVTKTTRDSTDLLVATTAKVEVSKLIESYAGLGFVPRSLLYQPLCYLALASREQPLGDNYVIVDLGASCTNVLAVSNGLPMYARTLREGGHRLDVALAKHFNLSTDEARRGKEGTARIWPEDNTTPEGVTAVDAPTLEAREVSKVLTNALKPIIVGLRQTLLPLRESLHDAVIYTTGGGSYLPGLNELIGNELGMECKQVPLPPALAERPDGHCLTSVWCLGQTGGSANRASKVDFRQDEFAFRANMSQLRSVVPKLVAGVAAVALLALTAGITSYATVASDERALDNTLKDVTKKLMGREIEDFKTALTAMKQAMQPEKSIIPRNTALDYIATLSQVIPKEIDVKTRQIDIKPDRISLKAETTNFDSVDKVAEALRAGACFKDVQVTQSRKAVDGSRVDFTITIELGGCPAS